MPREYSQAGVDYTKIEPFKQAMQVIGKRTLNFPNRRGVYIDEEAGDVFEYRGTHKPLWHMIQEGLGNKNWIAEWMYQHTGTGRTYYEGIGIDTALMAVVDVLRRGAFPVAYTLFLAGGQMKVIEKTLPGQLESCRCWRGVLGFVSLNRPKGTRTLS